MRYLEEGKDLSLLTVGFIDGVLLAPKAGKETRNKVEA